MKEKGYVPLDKLVVPDGGFDVIVVDPPWPIKKIKRKVRPNQKAIDYEVMSIEAIKKLPVGRLSSLTSICFLWTIDKFLYISKDIIEGWGFKYHCTMAWNKTNGISIYGFNRRVEFIVVGFKGKHEMYPRRKTIPTGFTARSLKHSQKPEEFYDFLDVLPGRKIDLFARGPKKGWYVWGDEVQITRELIP